MCQGPKFPFTNSCPHQQIEQMAVIGEPGDPRVVRTHVHHACTQYSIIPYETLKDDIETRGGFFQNDRDKKLCCYDIFQKTVHNFTQTLRTCTK